MIRALNLHASATTPADAYLVAKRLGFDAARFDADRHTQTSRGIDSSGLVGHVNRCKAAGLLPIVGAGYNAVNLGEERYSGIVTPAQLASAEAHVTQSVLLNRGCWWYPFNEPNHWAFWKSPNATAYCRWGQRMARIVKGIDKSAKVLGLELACGVPNHLEYHEEAAAAGLYEWADYLALHCYDPSGMPIDAFRQVEPHRAIMRKWGHNLPILVTETGLDRERMAVSPLGLSLTKSAGDLRTAVWRRHIVKAPVRCSDPFGGTAAWRYDGFGATYQFDHVPGQIVVDVWVRCAGSMRIGVDDRSMIRVESKGQWQRVSAMAEQDPADPKPKTILLYGPETGESWEVYAPDSRPHAPVSEAQDARVEEFMARLETDAIEAGIDGYGMFTYPRTDAMPFALPGRTIRAARTALAGL